MKTKDFYTKFKTKSKCSHVPMFPCSHDKGFTLIELLVSLSILIMVILAAMGIYIRVLGTREETLGQLNLQEDGQYLMSLLVKDIRAGIVDYDNYGGTLSSPEDELLLLDFFSNQIRYKRELIGSRYVLKRCEGNPCGTYQTITMTNIGIGRLDFYINPTSDPFTAGSTTYSHPRVTIVLKLESLLEGADLREIVLQQTVPQRYTYRK